MVISKILTSTGGKWLNGKWVKSAVETVTDTISKSPVAKESIASKTLINFKTKPLTTDVLEIGTKTSTIDIVKSFGLKSTPRGFVFELSPEIEQQILADYGHSITAQRMINRLRNPLTPKDVKNIETLLSKSSEITNITEISPYRIVNLYKIMKINYGKDIDKLLADLTPDKATIILNGARCQNISEAQLEAISRYKNAGIINEVVGKVGISQSQQDEINLISSYIKSQKLPTSTTVYRMEGYMPNTTEGYDFGCLDTTKLQGEYKGLSIAQVMDRINRIKDPKLKQAEYLKLRKYITSPENECIAQNNKFMSTFLVDKLEPQANTMIWELNVPKGTEAAFLEGVVQNNSAAHELELLLQKDSTLKIKDIIYESKTNAWKIIADVDNKGGSL